MKPIDFRNETWRDVQERFAEGLRQQVYRALEKHGPCTTRELAQRSGIDILSLRPRVTELYQLGLAELANPEPGGGEGVYQAVSWFVARDNFDRKKREAKQTQLNLL
jgi:transcription initiation factor IIE alpha subunit